MGEDRLRLTRLGLVGVGAWGRRYLETVRRRQDCRITAWARASSAPPPDENLVEGARRCASASELLQMAQQGELDGLIVATTPANQATLAEAACVAGLPALVEKPLGLSADSARQVLRAFQQSRAKPPILVNHIHLWAPAYRALKALVRAAPGGSESIATINCRGHNRGPVRGWSSLYDYGPHDLAMCLDLMGIDAPFHLRTASRTASPDVEGADLFDAQFALGVAAVTLRVGNGATDKARLFAVAFRDGRRIVYDDTRAGPFKLVDGDAPVALEGGSPLDGVISTFLAEIAAARTRRVGDAGTSLALAVRVSDCLAAISHEANGRI